MEISESNILGVELVNKDHSITIHTDKQIEDIVKALSSQTRRQILQQIQTEPMDVSNIASNLSMTEANISAQIKKLEKAELVICEYCSGQHGVRKISRLKYDEINIKI
jgi:predicted transcriptional regulator